MLRALFLSLWLWVGLTYPRPVQAAVTPCQGGASACPNQALTHPNNKILPILYEFGDYQNTNWAASHPDWGAVGSWYYESWKRVQPSSETSFSPFRDYLNKICQDYNCTVSYQGQNFYKPVALSVLLTTDGVDLTPDWVYTSGAQKLMIPSSTADCPDIQIPAWNDGRWQEAYTEMVFKLGDAFKNDPLVDSIWIASGNYGETATTVNIGNCRYDLGYNGYFGNWLSRGWYVDGQRRSIPALYRAAFGQKPLFMLITHNSLAKDLSDTACQAGVGFKTNTLAGDTTLAYDYKAGGGGMAQIADRLKETCPIGYEHAFGDNSWGAYWALMSSLAHGVDVLDLESRESQGGTQFFSTIAATRMPSGEGLWDFWQQHAGHGFRSGESQPEAVWIMLREAEPAKSYPQLTVNGQEFGDWEFYLYRPENTCRGLPAGTCEANTDMGNRYNTDLPAATTAYVPRPQVGDYQGIYGAWGARKTTNNGSMFFKVDERWAGRQAGKFTVGVTYWGGSGTFALEYYDQGGSKQREVVTKRSSGWQYQEVVLTNADLTKGSFPGGTSLALSANSDGDDTFHLLVVTPGEGVSPPPSDFPFATKAGWHTVYTRGEDFNGGSLKASRLVTAACPLVGRGQGWRGFWQTFVKGYSSSGSSNDITVARDQIYHYRCLRPLS